MDKDNKTTEQQAVNAEKHYPGVATDAADDNKDNAQRVKNNVRELNNNPRNNDIDQ